MKSKKKKAKAGKSRSSLKTPRFQTKLQKAELLLQSGRLQEAAALCSDILRRSPTHAGALHILGIAHARAGRLGAAVDLLAQAVKAEPYNSAYLYNLAGACEDDGKYDQAAAAYHEVLRLDPDDEKAAFYLGRTLFALGRQKEAIDCFRQAQRNPKFKDASYNLGVIYSTQGRREEAIAAFRKALEITPDNPLIHCTLGKALGESGRLDEAVACFQEALRLDPEYAEAYYSLGVLYNTHGRMAEALASYQKALEVNPEYTIAYCALSKLKKFAWEDPQIAKMKQLHARPGLTDEQRLYLAFGLGKAMEDCGEYAQSFAYLREGNELKRQSYQYSLAETKAEFAQIKEIFSPSFVKRHGEAGSRDDTPIFILGMPRSGTSLVEQILASHPEVCGGGELLYVRDIVFQLAGTGKEGSALAKLATEADRLIPRFAAAYLEKLRSSGQNVCHILTDHGDAQREKPAMAEKVPQMRGIDLRGIHMVCEQADNKADVVPCDRLRYITDKLPHNFVFIGLLRLAFPRAKIIHCVRGPMDTCFSIYKQLFTGEHPYAYDLEELGQYYLLYRDLMAHWHRLFPGALYDIGYEGLVRDQGKEIKKLLEHCGLSWDSRCLSFYDTAREVNTASLAQVRKPIYQSSVQLWRRYEKWLQALQLILAEDSVQAE